MIISLKMGSFFYNKNRKVLINYMEFYFSQKPTDCTFYSVDGYEFPIHKVSFQKHPFMHELKITVTCLEGAI